MVKIGSIGLLVITTLLILTTGLVIGGSPSLTVIQHEKIGEWIKIKVSISSDIDQTLTFKSSQIALKMEDGSDIKEWRFLDFFPGATVDLNKGESISSVGTELGDSLVWATYLKLKDGRVATIDLPLKAGVSKEAIFLFQSPGSKKPARMVIGDLASGKIR